MNALNQIIGALVEAWGEVKVQKARVILSLVGVVAAVAAMSSVIAFGDMLVQANKELDEAYSGRSITLHVSASKTSSDTGETGAASSTENGTGTTTNAEGTPTTSSDGSNALTGVIHDPMGDAMTTVAQRLQIPYWSRLETGNITFTEIEQISKTGSYRGIPTTQDLTTMETSTAVKAVDPAYSTLFRLTPTVGRWIDAGDANQRVVPIVINSTLWKYLANANIADPIVLHANDASATQYRVVGVVKSTSQWDSPTAYIDYTAWQFTKSQSTALSGQSPASNGVEMLVWTGADQAEQARDLLPKALASVLGKDWKGDVYGGEGYDGGQSSMNTIRTVIMVIGGIVILLGALGLLNVAIVTVRQRVREIGIRRAMGASAKRVFFAVFMESVVATFVAGVIGVGIAIIVLRLLPIDTLGFYLQERPRFPMSAAIDGIAISTGIGALCGIIPALAAVRVKPIDAIRY
ncbi:ABC transporter permease [Schaalia turicensis]|uniref:ABC transporter permease n=1 Tax=Schaalia turicensis TaxID=131111 RepID=UPI003FA4982B